MITVPRLWPGETVVCIGGGPSLTQADIDACIDIDLRGIAVNDAYRMAPWADVLYAADAKWWGWHNGAPKFYGLKYSIDGRDRVAYCDVMTLRNTGWTGLELDPTGLRAGHNSGYQAINLAVHLGAKRILLLGYDMTLGTAGESHWFGEHPDGLISPYPQMREAFDTIVEPLAALGVEVLNCSRRTALTAFPCVALEDALAKVAA